MVQTEAHRPSIRQPFRARITPQNAHRCGQPGQQHGRRTPSLSSEHTLSTCCRLVSSFLTEMVQQIHSLRASGVMSSQAASAFASNASAFPRSAGRLCTTPPEIRTAVIGSSCRLKDQASDTRVQLGFRDDRDRYGNNPRFAVLGYFRFAAIRPDQRARWSILCGQCELPFLQWVY
jgi:hypothetical protein